jgi:hypothetical protein
MIKIITKTLLIGFLSTSCVTLSAELTHHFSSPSFSGIGYGNHVLTIQQLENQAKERNQTKADALAARAAAEAANTPQARFLANIESRIYAQLAKQITDSLFGTDGAPSCSAVNPYSQCGAVNIAGNDISWRLGDPAKPAEAGMIVINISGGTGDVEMKVPSGTFYF